MACSCIERIVLFARSDECRETEPFSLSLSLSLSLFMRTVARRETRVIAKVSLPSRPSLKGKSGKVVGSEV
jgi:hypothetical protein